MIKIGRPPEVIFVHLTLFTLCYVTYLTVAVGPDIQVKIVYISNFCFLTTLNYLPTKMIKNKLSFFKAIGCQ